MMLLTSVTLGWGCPLFVQQTIVDNGRLLLGDMTPEKLMNAAIRDAMTEPRLLESYPRFVKHMEEYVQEFFHRSQMDPALEARMATELAEFSASVQDTISTMRSDLRTAYQSDKPAQQCFLFFKCILVSLLFAV